MLTRLEADGFKNLLGFAAEFGPYTCIAGPNAAGKSNIFDAIAFLSLLADRSFMEAASLVRSAGDRPADPQALFWDGGAAGNRRMKLAAEMIVASEVDDDFGRVVKPTATFLRYELELEYRQPDIREPMQMGRIALLREHLGYIRVSDAASKMPWRHSKREFRDAIIFNRRQGTAYISTTDEEGIGIVNVHQDGGSRGQPRKSPARRAPRTVVSTTTTSDDPTILAARREMQQWRMLALEPSAMRTPDGVSDPSSVASNGAHLAAALYRMRSTQSEDAYAEVAAAASALTDVRDVTVDYDLKRELLTLSARLGDGLLLPARNLSDGTLRFLALCIMANDAEYGGLICMEEPENGIHPARMNAMVDLVRELAVDPSAAPGDDNPFRQVIVNTHSPYFVQLQRADDLVLALPSAVRRGDSTATTVRLLPMQDSWRARALPVAMTMADVSDYLRNPPGSQLELDLEATGSAG